MRIVSQNRKTDIPYELFGIQANDWSNNHKTQIIAFKTDAITIGTYSSKEKALKVMEMIRKAYMNNELCFYMPQDNEVIE